MPAEKSILLPLSYLGPIQLYCRYFSGGNILVEQHDSYQKQTYRNRCDIFGANGRLSLIVPVKHEHGKRLLLKEVKIDYATDWRRLHWKGIESAYNSSPYFEYYRDIFEPCYKREFAFLVDLCLHLNEEILKILGISTRPVLTNEYFFHGKGEGEQPEDLRDLIHPKKGFEADKGFRIVEYSQVFNQAHGFMPNLSVLDLIFNMGPEASGLLDSSRV